MKQKFHPFVANMLSYMAFINDKGNGIWLNCTAKSPENSKHIEIKHAVATPMTSPKFQLQR